MSFFSLLGMAEKKTLLPMTMSFFLALVMTTLKRLGLFRNPDITRSKFDEVKPKITTSLSAPCTRSTVSMRGSSWSVPSSRSERRAEMALFWARWGGDEGDLLRLNGEMGDHPAGDTGDNPGFRSAFLMMPAMIHKAQGYGSIRIDQPVYFGI